MGSHGTRNWVAIAHAAAELLEGIDDVAAGNLSIDDIKADRRALREALAGVPTPVASRQPPTEPADDPPSVLRGRGAEIARAVREALHRGLNAEPCATACTHVIEGRWTANGIANVFARRAVELERKEDSL